MRVTGSPGDTPWALMARRDKDWLGGFKTNSSMVEKAKGLEVDYHL